MCFLECASHAFNENIHKFDILLMLILLAFEYAHIGCLKTPTSSKIIECACNVNIY